MMEANWIEFIIKLGSTCGAAIVSSQFIAKIWDRLVVKPRNKFSANILLQSTKQMEEAVSPLTKAIEKLNMSLTLSEIDRKDLREDMGKISEDVKGVCSEMGKHHTRLTRLEAIHPNSTEVIND